MSTLRIILKEGTIDKQWCLQLAEQMFDNLTKTCEHTKILAPEMFLIIKIISYVTASYDADELSLTKKLLHFIFQSLLKMPFGDSHVSLIYTLS